MHEHEIEAEMHLSDSEDVKAFGTVTIDQCIKFPVQMRKYRDQDSGEEKMFLSFPSRRGKNGWEDVVRPSKELREEIIHVVGETIKRELMKDLILPELESVEVTPLAPAGKEAKVKICGVVTVQVCGLSIHGITIKQGERGLFVNMPRYKNGEGTYKDIVYGTSGAMREKIAQAVLDTYNEVVKQKEEKITVQQKPMKGAAYGKTI